VRTPTTTGSTTPTTTPTIDLSGFLIAHAGMRQEFGLLARVAARPLDPARAALAEDQLAMVLEVLHHHHTAEDDTIWPTLLARVPSAAGDLDALEAEHARLDPLIAAAGDTSRPLAERAPVLAELHELINAHLDREEATAVPLIRAHITAAEWAALTQRAIAETGRRKLPTVYGWYASAAPAALRAEAVATVPALVRVLLRLFWWPAYQRRARRLYGADAPASIAHGV
jgi:hemerythrin HHE cation binding domain-containing protein